MVNTVVGYVVKRSKDKKWEYTSAGTWFARAARATNVKFVSRVKDGARLIMDQVHMLHITRRRSRPIFMHLWVDFIIKY